MQDEPREIDLARRPISRSVEDGRFRLSLSRDGIEALVCVYMCVCVSRKKGRRITLD